MGSRALIVGSALGVSLAVALQFLASPAVAQRTAVVHWQHFHEGRAGALRELARAFERNHPGIAIEADLLPYEQYFEKLLLVLAAGRGPDVFQVPMKLSEQLINGGFLAPVPHTVAGAEEIAAAFLPWTTERFRRGRRYYGLPTDVQHLVLYVNDDLARRAGLDPARPPQTWLELLAAARRATVRAPDGLVQAGLDTRFRWAVHTALLYQSIDGPVVDARGRKVTYGGPQGLGAWRLVEQLIRGPGAVDSPMFLPGQRKFELQRAVFYVNHPVARSVIARLAPDLTYTIAPLPGLPGRPPISPGHHWAYVVNARTAHAEAAWRWVQFLTSRTAQRTWIQVAGDLPSLVDLLADPLMSRTAKDRVVLATLKHVRPVEFIGDCEDYRDALWDAIALTSRPVEHLVAEAVAKEDACIAQALR